MNSLCNLPQCTNPETCALCDIIRRPRPLSARDIARLQLTPARVTAIGDMRKAELQRQIDAERARNAQLKSRLDSMPAIQTRAGALAHVTIPPPNLSAVQASARVERAAEFSALVEAAVFEARAAELPAVTAPMPAPVALAPAPTPKPPPVSIDGPLRAGDWVGLAARVERGVLTQAQGEAIGRAWIAEKGGATATA